MSEQKLRVVLDTNTTVSGLLWDGNESRLLDLVDAGTVSLVLSEEILEEIGDVLSRPKLRTHILSTGLTVEELLNKLISVAHLVEPKSRIEIVKADSSDNKILECALEGRADYVISGDRHLLTLEEFGNTKIVRTREILDLIKKNQ